MLGSDRIFEKIFIPRMQINRFDYARYIRDLEKGVFRDRFNFGVCEEGGGKWLMEDFVQSPNALFVGGMGSGKSVSCRFTMLTWLLSNSDKTILFVVDTLKGAQDYKMLFPLSQVYDVVDSLDGVYRVIELAFDEMQERNKLFREHGVESVAAYEQKTGNKMARVVILFEEFHNIPNNVLNFDKDHKIPNTHANKFHTIMRVGRAMGVWVIACTQKSTSGDVPPQMVSNFSNKNIFRVSRGESNYVLGSDKAALIRTSQKGRCFTERGEVQFPFIDEKTIAALLKMYVKPMDAKMALLTKTMIEDSLAGEVYKHKKISELVKNFEKSDTTMVITRLNQMMGNRVESLDDNKFGLSHIVTWKKTGQKVAVMIKTDVKKLQLKHINNLINGINVHHCVSGILYTHLENIPANVIKFAKENFIEIVDREDLDKLAIEVEKNQNNGEFYINPDDLADPSKENGEFQRERGIQDYNFDAEEDDDFAEVQEAYSSAQNRGYGEDEQETVVESKERPVTSSDEEDELNKFVDSLDIDTMIEETAQKIEAKAPVNEEPDSPFAPPRSGTELTGIKRQKRPTLNMTFKLNPEEYPSLMINCLRNSEGEIYRALFYVLIKDRIKHKYYLDRKVKSNFSFIEKKKLGIRDEQEWNSDPLVLENHEFEELISRYLENFSPCENPIYVICWSKDEQFVQEQMINQSKHLASAPTILENHIFNVLGVRQTREEIIHSLNLRVDESDAFEEIERDYEIWKHMI